MVAVGGKPLAAREDLNTALYSVAAGTPVALEVRRGDDTVRISLQAMRPPAGLGARVLERSVGLAVEARKGSLVVTVNNVTPTVAAGPDATLDEGGTFLGTGSMACLPSDSAG